LEVVALVEEHFGDHPGHIDVHTLPSTAQDATELWAWATAHCMECFGPYEDAMSTASRTVFHTLISQTLNLHRLLPRQVVEDVVAMDLPLNSKEGFVRQVLGWREFVYHVHEQTQGFRALPTARKAPEVRDHIGDARWHDKTSKRLDDALDGRFAANACPNAMDAHGPLPQAFWGKKSGLFCLDHVVEQVMQTGYSHHIERLMVLGNIATLLDISPRELTDWVWVSYVDAYDWVVEPNVLGMATFGLGDLFTTKPYIAGSNYINKMSNYCTSCAFHPTKTCPISHMYWAYLARHELKLSKNFRMNLTMGSLRKRSASKRSQDERVFARVEERLAKGQALTPEDIKQAQKEP
jgi:deoxyribodipyrimidine photolyase-related protein